jgi:hypothetical protein
MIERNSHARRAAYPETLRRILNVDRARGCRRWCCAVLPCADSWFRIRPSCIRDYQHKRRVRATGIAAEFEPG